MNKYSAKFSLVLILCLTLGLCLLVSACSDNNREPSQPIPDEETATVDFVFELASAKSVVPSSVVEYQFIGYTDVTMKQECSHDPWHADKADPAEGILQIVSLTDVPTDVVRFQILYLDAAGKAIASSASEVVSLEAGKTTEIAITEINPLVTSDVTLNVTNAYATGLDSLDKVNYTVVYNSSFGNDLQDTGETAFTVSADKGACEIKWSAPGENIAVTSVKLTNPATSVPFEWLDYAIPQMATSSPLVLDVEANKYAGGSGTEADPFLVGNPRQLESIGADCTGGYFFRQTKDIDFEGSCGLEIKVSADAEKIIYDVTEKDIKARYYNEKQGWKSIGSDTAQFKGTYDGDGHIIDGVVSYKPMDYNVGLLGCTESCTVKNLTMGKNCILVGSYGGSFIGDSYALDLNTVTVQLENCHTQATVAGYNHVGAWIGDFQGKSCTISQCTASGTVYAGGYVGAVGYASVVDDMNFSDCEVGGSLTLAGELIGGGMCELGGLCSNAAGAKAVKIKNCNCSAAIKAMAPKQSYNLKMGGFLACYDDLDGIYVTFEGKNTVTSVIDNSACPLEVAGIGGVIGSLSYDSTRGEELKNALRGKVEVTATIPAGEKCGKYCGNPKIDTL